MALVDLALATVVVGNFVSGFWLWGTWGELRESDERELGEPDGELSWALTGEPRAGTLALT